MESLRASGGPEADGIGLLEKSGGSLGAVQPARIKVVVQKTGRSIEIGDEVNLGIRGQDAIEAADERHRAGLDEFVANLVIGGRVWEPELIADVSPVSGETPRPEHQLQGKDTDQHRGQGEKPRGKRVPGDRRGGWERSRGSRAFRRRLRRLRLLRGVVGCIGARAAFSSSRCCRKRSPSNDESGERKGDEPPSDVPGEESGFGGGDGSRGSVVGGERLEQLPDRRVVEGGENYACAQSGEEKGPERGVAPSLRIAGRDPVGDGRSRVRFRWRGVHRVEKGTSPRIRLPMVASSG